MRLGTRTLALRGHATVHSSVERNLRLSSVAVFAERRATQNMGMDGHAHLTNYGATGRTSVARRNHDQHFAGANSQTKPAPSPLSPVLPSSPSSAAPHQQQPCATGFGPVMMGAARSAPASRIWACGAHVVGTHANARTRARTHRAADALRLALEHQDHLDRRNLVKFPQSPWCVTDRQADRQTDRQTDKQVDRQADRQRQSQTRRHTRARHTR